jgi:large subunit ribosomal protein L12
MPTASSDTMEYVYAALMLHKLKKDINEANITSLVKASGAEVNEAQVKALVASLADVNIEEAIKAAPVAVAAAGAAPAEAAAGGGAKKEDKPTAEEKGKTEEAAMEGLSALFG